LTPLIENVKKASQKEAFLLNEVLSLAFTKIRKMKKVMIMGIALLGVSFTYSQTNERLDSRTYKPVSTVSMEEKTSVEPIPHKIQDDLPGFPEFVNTGNPTVDNANYLEAKQNWILENQDLYNKYVESLKQTYPANGINTQGNSNTEEPKK
jgi:hypothetical protein